MEREASPRQRIMRVQRRSTALIISLLLLAAAPASATVITASALHTPSESGDENNSSVLEFGVEDWVFFISNEATEFQLSGLGSGIDVFGAPDRIQAPPTQGDADSVLTQIWERP